MTSTLATAWNQQAPFETALDALERFQWSVFPLDQDKRPPQIGQIYPDGTAKRLSWKHLQNRRPSPKEIQLWQEIYHPSAWAVITGGISNLIALDFDGEAGQELCRQLGLNPHVQTGSGGYHTYFQHPGWHVPTLNGKSKQLLGEHWPGLDLRGDGGYAAFCGHNRHGQYIWLRDPIPNDLSILPEDLRAMLGLIHPSASARYAYELLLQALQDSKRGRNDAGFWLACQLRDHGCDQAEAADMMLKYASRVAQVNSKGQFEPYTSEEALSSLTSAYRREPRVSWHDPASDDGRDLPCIYIGDQQLRVTVDQAVDALVRYQSDAPKFFLQSSRLISVGRDEEDQPIINQLDATDVRAALTQAANFYASKPSLQRGQTEPTYRSISPPRELAEQVLARQSQEPRLPFGWLKGLVEVPILRPDGSICDQPGYDQQTRLYYTPPPNSDPCHIPANPTAQEIDAALTLIWDTFGEFSYASEADRANTLGLLMTPLVRPIIKYSIPIALVDAPKKGSGKTMLINCMSILATGRMAPLMSIPGTEEEWGKSVLAALLKGQTIICLDNVHGILQSATLDLLLTSDMYQGRVLGQSYTAHVPNRSMWSATGNNLKVGGDLARRAYWIRLDPGMSSPWERTGFRHSDLIDWVIKQRMALIRAFFVLVRAWYAAGTPQASGVPVMGTFSHWANTIGSILAYVGIPGFLSNLSQFYQEADETSAQWETFLQAWHDTLGSNWVKIADVVQLFKDRIDGASDQANSTQKSYTSNDQTSGASDQDQTSIDLVEALPERLQMLLREKPASFKVSLGKELGKHVDECFGADNLRLERGGKDRKGAVLWRVNSSIADHDLTNLQRKKPSSSRRDAEGAEGAEGDSARLELKTESLFAESLPQNEIQMEWQNPRHPRQSHVEDMPQTSLGSGSMPIENNAESFNELPAPPALSQPTVPSSVPNDQINDCIASNNVTASSNHENEPIATNEVYSSDDEEWEEFTI